MSSLQSAALSRVKPSATLAVTARARELKREGRDVIGLGAGEPDFDTPDNIKEAAIAAIRRGETKYTDVDGLPELKMAVAAKFARENGLTYGVNQIHVAPGGKTVIYNALLATLSPGDEVIVPAPYWVSYPEQARLCGATVVEVPGSVDNDFKITPDQLEKAITPRSKVLIINSPSNPNGTMYSPAELKALAEVVLRHPQLIVFADDIYERLVYGTDPFVSWASLHPDLFERTVTFNCLSKSYAMTGWRVGFTVAEPKLIKAMSGLQGQMTSNITSFIYPAIVAALTGPQDEVEKMRQTFDGRGQLMHRLFSAIPGVKCCKPTGAFYVFPDISAYFGKTDPAGKKLETAAAFAESLLSHAQVAVVPGEDFAGPNHVRASFATSNQNIEQGLEKLARFVEQLR